MPCWHGHRAFLDELFLRAPLAEVIDSPLGTFAGAVDYRMNHQDSAYRNLGTVNKPLMWVDACACSEDGSIADEWGHIRAPAFTNGLKPLSSPQQVYASWQDDPAVKVYDYSPEDGVWTRTLPDGTVEMLCD